MQRAESVTLAFGAPRNAFPEERAVFILKEACDFDHREMPRPWGSRSELAAAAAPRESQRCSRQVEIDRHHILETRGRKPVARARCYLATASPCRICSPPTLDCGAMAAAKCAARRPLLGRDEVMKFLVGLSDRIHELARKERSS